MPSPPASSTPSTQALSRDPRNRPSRGDEAASPGREQRRRQGGNHGAGRKAGFETANAAKVAGPVFYAPGVLVEECVEGEEFSIDCAVYHGQVTPVFVATQGTWPGLPAFEEVGHVVTAEDLTCSPASEAYLQAVHEALGYRDGVTHAELRVSDRVPDHGGQPAGSAAA